MVGKSPASLVAALFLVAVTVAVPAPQQNDNLVEIVPPVSLQPIPDVDVYEVTVPLVLHINTTTWLSSMDNMINLTSVPSPCNDRGDRLDVCELHKVMLELISSQTNPLHEELRLLFDIAEKDEKPRRKVDLTSVTGIVGAGSVGKKWFNRFIGSEADWKAPMAYVAKQTSLTVKYLHRVQDKQEAFNTRVTAAFQNIKAGDRDLYEKNIAANVNMLVDIMQNKDEQVDVLRSAMTDCRTNLIPFRAIGWSVVAEQLRYLERELAQNGLELTINLARLTDYAKLQMADCMFTRQSMVVVINVPAKTIGKVWTMSKVVRSQFAFDNELCELYPHETSYVATADDDVVFIHGHLLPTCNLEEDRLCMIPQYQRDTAHSISKCI